MPTHQGISQNVIYPQPGFSPRRDDRGGWTATQDYIVLRSSWQNQVVRNKFARGTPILTIDPTLEPFYGFLALADVSATHEEGDHVRLSCVFTGSQEFGFDPTTTDTIADGAAFTTRLEIRERQEGILTSKAFQDLATREQDALRLLLAGGVVYISDQFGDDGPKLYFTPQGTLLVQYFDQLSSAGALDLADRISRGQTTRTVYSVSWVVTTEGMTPITAAQLDRLNQARTPPGNPPTPATRDWKFIGATQETHGELVRTTLEYELSEPGGWPAILE
jgi:hypothetical protein